MAVAAFLLPLISIFVAGYAPTSSGFSVELVHYDSPLSPFYNASETVSYRASRAVRSASSRLDYFRSKIAASETAAAGNGDAQVSSIVIPNGGGYLMKLSLGTPPFEIFSIADTGSDLIWAQCSPCSPESCYKQDAPLFDPSKSTSYATQPCTSKACSALPMNRHQCRNDRCLYYYSYGDQPRLSSYTTGVLSSEMLSLASSGGGLVGFPNVAFGCGYMNKGNFNSRMAGLVGLGRGTLSLISQLEPAIHGKFAYCLLSPFRRSASYSLLHFGDSGTVTGAGAVSSPLLFYQMETFFSLSLEKISVKEKTIPVPPGQGEEGNIFLDSGTTFTVLPPSVYEQFLPALKDAINLQSFPYHDFNPCYRFEKEPGQLVPEVKFGFRGAEVVLGWENLFFQVDEGILCAAFRTSDISIFGNVAQQNFKIGYDLQSMKVTFQPTDCSANQ